MLKRLWVPSLIFLVGTGGCGEDPPLGYGNLQVDYRVGSGRDTCEEREISFVRVYLSSSDSANVFDEIYPCAGDAQSVVVTEIAEGRYSVRVDGLDESNAVIYRGESPGPVEVKANQTNGPVTVVLTQLRPAMQLWFGFSEAGGCERFKVSSINVVLYENGRSVIFDESYPCPARLTEALLIDNLSETATYDLRVRGTNDLDEPAYQYNQDGITVGPGSPAEVSVSLSPCSGICAPP